MAIRITLDVSEIEAFGHRLDAAADNIADDAEQVVARTTYAMLGDAQQLAPVDTGFLVASGSADIDGLTAEWGFSAHYARYQEFGTSKMRANPFVGPAFDRHEQPFLAAIAALGVRGI